jgi:hypothetical protein
MSIDPARTASFSSGFDSRSRRLSNHEILEAHWIASALVFEVLDAAGAYTNNATSIGCRSASARTALYSAPPAIAFIFSPLAARDRFGDQAHSGPRIVLAPATPAR